jgi:hypothetical protein
MSMLLGSAVRPLLGEMGAGESGLGLEGRGGSMEAERLAEVADGLLSDVDELGGG